MAFRVMIKEGYQLGKGLGPHLSGIPAPIMIRENKGKVGLGYQGGNQDRDPGSPQVGSALSQHYVRGNVAMIRNKPMGQ
ncbi:hypothetical protein CR513_32333, partial [Mucuna pruriens]